MRTHPFSAGFALGALLLFAGAGAGAEEDPVERLFDLRLPTIEGGTLSTSSLRGKKTLLIQFASW